MQHTEKRGFNIIETSDSFSPEALNENTRKIEAALDAAEAHADAGDAALAQRVTVLEAKRFASGFYIGNGQTTQTIQLGFTPVALIVTVASNPNYLRFVVTGNDLGPGFMDNYITLAIAEGGFTVGYYNSSSNWLNLANMKYNYIAFG